MVVITGTNNEAAIRDQLELPVNFTCADGTGFLKGTLLSVTDPRTASSTVAANAAIAGIAAVDKVANDGRTSIAVYRRGIFDMVASGAVAVGQPVCAAGVDNMVKYIATASVSGAQVIGHALETATDQELFQVELTL